MNSEKDIEAVMAEFEADWCECGQDCHVAARLILDARRERDAALACVRELRAVLAEGESNETQARIEELDYRATPKRRKVWKAWFYRKPSTGVTFASFQTPFNNAGCEVLAGPVDVTFEFDE